MIKSKTKQLKQFSIDMLYLIEDEDLDGESLMYALTARYGLHQGHMFLCQVFPKSNLGDNFGYSWWVITNDIAVEYHRLGGYCRLRYWASRSEAKQIEGLVELCAQSPY